ncbi:TPA: rhomboid family intramembrane serine protease [Providencia stuartii]
MAEQQNPFSIKSKARFSLGAIALTLTLVLLNIAVYFYQIVFASPLDSRESNLILFGANIYQLSLTGDWWRYPISMMLHSNGTHLAFNCLALFVIGIGCERAYGKFKLLAIYIISGIGAALFSAYWQYYEISNSDLWTDSTVYITIGVGASGAIMGIAAASVIYLIKVVINKPNPHPIIQRRQKYQLYNLIAMIALTLINGLQSGVDNAAHIGGAIIGALISIAYILVPHKLRVANLCITVIAASLLTMMIYLYSFSTNKHLLEEREFIYQEVYTELADANQ